MDQSRGKYNVTKEELLAWKDKLVSLCSITESDVRDIWIENRDENVDDLSTLVYHWDAPLYQKMIWRLRNSRGHVAGFWNGLDPCNRKILTSRYKLHDDPDRAMNFMVWICCTLGLYHIEKISPSLVEVWQKNNAIFLYFLTDEQLTALIKRHNDDIRSFEERLKRLEDE